MGRALAAMAIDLGSNHLPPGTLESGGDIPPLNPVGPDGQSPRPQGPANGLVKGIDALALEHEAQGRTALRNR
eukprot:7266204-Alexandrium_andersonii.AAC.1